MTGSLEDEEEDEEPDLDELDVDEVPDFDTSISFNTETEKFKHRMIPSTLIPKDPTIPRMP